MLRVAMVIQRYHPHVGGAENLVRQLSLQLQLRGFDICVLTRLEPGLAKFELIDNVPVYRLPSPGPKPLAALFFTWSATKLLGKLRPDIVHAHELLSPTTIALVSKYIYQWPVIATVHRGGWLGDIFRLKRRPFGSLRLQRIRQDVDSFSVISTEIDDELASLGISRNRRILIPNGVDTELFVPLAPEQKKRLRKNLSLPLRAQIVIYAGRFVAEKRVDHLLKVWPEVKTTYPDALLLLAGDGPEDHRLRGMSTPGVRFVGRIDDPSSYFQASDVYILPSSTEGLSISMLEAMSCGLPAIVTAVGGAPDVIQHGINGHLIPPGDLCTLSEALQTLLGNSNYRTLLGKNGRQRILMDFSLTSVTERLISLYMNLLNVNNR